MAAYRSPLAGSTTGCRWLMLAAEMAGLADGGRQPGPDPASAGRVCPPRIAIQTLGTDAGSVRAARDFTLATLHRWGITERGHDIAIVVSELVTNALRHALPMPRHVRLRPPVRLGLLQAGPCLLCAVADLSKAAPVPRRPGSLAEAGRGLHIICALSDEWGYTTTPGGTGKVVWSLFTPRPAPFSTVRYPGRPAIDRVPGAAV
jgi:anti-sigma regulatory factor (Ser/Thr protein kinase)